MKIKQALLGLAISTVAMSGSASTHVQSEVSKDIAQAKEIEKALESYASRALINQYKDDLLSAAIDSGIEVQDAVKERDALFLASSNDSRNIPSTGGCHSACHSACHGSRGWR